MSGNWQERVSANKARVEAAIAEAQRAGRMVMHCFEYEDVKRSLPRDLLEDIKKNTALFAQPPSVLGDHQLATPSTTLLASVESGNVVSPFSQNDFGEVVGYLFNIDEKKPNPARVVRVLRQQHTDRSNFSKNLFLDESSPEIQALFSEEYKRSCPQGQTPSLRGAYMNDAFRNPEKYAQKLGGLAATFAGEVSRKLPWNEVLVAVTPEHIEAIFVPVSRVLETNGGGLYKAHAQLRGALAGLAYAKEMQRDLPVVTYHLDPPHQGQCIYFAQGEEECRQKALEALHAMQKNPLFLAKAKGELINVFKATDANASYYLGLENIYKPLQEQGITLSGAGMKL